MYSIPNKIVNTNIEVTNIEVSYPSLFDDSVFKIEPSDVSYSTEIDILAVSHAWYRLRKLKPQVNDVSNLASPELKEYVESIDVVQALAIREYYSKLLVMLQLRGNEPSAFRKELARFLSSDTKTWMKSQGGLIFSLPEFFYYDTTLDLYKEKVFTSLPNYASATNAFVSRKLKPVVRLDRRTKYANSRIYWYEIEKSGQAARINLIKSNQLLHVWDDLFDSDQEINVRAKFVISKRGNFDHYCVDKWTLEDRLST